MYMGQWAICPIRAITITFEQVGLELLHLLSKQGEVLLGLPLLLLSLSSLLLSLSRLYPSPYGLRLGYLHSLLGKIDLPSSRCRVLSGLEQIILELRFSSNASTGSFLALTTFYWEAMSRSCRRGAYSHPTWVKWMKRDFTQEDSLNS